jgi:dephospho-CoA kinase
MMILGITGHAVAGKDTVSEYLVKKHGFQFVSTGDLVREEVKLRGLGEPTRDLLIKVGTEMRTAEGPDVLIKRGLKRYADAKRIVFGGVRALPESRYIQEQGGKIISIQAPAELRFKRSQLRGRKGDGETFAEFMAKEKIEGDNKNLSAQNINGVIAEADFTIDNSGTFEELYLLVDKVIQEIESV